MTSGLIERIGMNCLKDRWFVPLLMLAAAVMAGERVQGAEFIWQESGAGLAKTSVTNPGPVIFTVVRVVRTGFQHDLSLTSTHAGNTVVGLSALSNQVRALPAEWGTPVAAMNADFFMMSGSAMGDPRGVQIMRGELPASRAVRGTSPVSATR